MKYRLGAIIGPLIGILLAPPGAGAQQVPVVDAAVYHNAEYGVSLPRPFGDWIFEPAASGGTATVIFHPRSLPLSRQMWGALVLAALPRPLPLGTIVDERVQLAWRPVFGRSFIELGRGSTTVAGLPAVRLEVGGLVGGQGVDVEEYALWHGAHLILLQFRYPRDRSRDSLAAGYRRSLDGLTLGLPEEGEDLAERGRAMGKAVEKSPWQVRAYEVGVRYDSATLRFDVAARLSLVNASGEARDSLALWLWPGFHLDSIRSGASGRVLQLAAGPALRVGLGSLVEPGDGAPVTVFYHLAPGSTRRRAELAAEVWVSSEEAYLMNEWLPRVQASQDSAGQYIRAPRPTAVLTFDLPAGWSAVTTGRLVSDATGPGRRRITWASEDIGAHAPGFAVSRFRQFAGPEGPPRVAFWLGEGRDAVSPARLDSLAELLALGWSFYSRAFGPLPISRLHVVATDLAVSTAISGVVFLDRAAGFFSGPLSDTLPDGSLRRDVVLRELARNWWGRSVSASGPGSRWITEGFAAWAAVAARGVLEGDSVRRHLVRRAEAAWRAQTTGGNDPPLAALSAATRSGQCLVCSKGTAALEAVRRTIGEARFREVILTFAEEHRGDWADLTGFLRLIGEDGAATLRPYLYGR